MRKIALAVLLATLGFGLGACSYVEEFYSSQCANLGGTWAGSGGCEGRL